ncbi:MAG: hypothetical protein ACR2FU_17240 [Streptosporangiaceae bacterium]
MRWDNRPGQSSRPGDIVIGAFVRARLLGLRLLTLEARVVIAKDDGSRQILPSWPAYPAASVRRRRPSGFTYAPGYVASAAMEPELERARELLAEGEDTLARIRLRLPAVPRD